MIPKFRCLRIEQTQLSTSILNIFTRKVKQVFSFPKSANLLRKLSRSSFILFLYSSSLRSFIKECIFSLTKIRKENEVSWQYLSLKNSYFILRRNCLSSYYLSKEVPALGFREGLFCNEYRNFHSFIIFQLKTGFLVKKYNN